MSKQEYVGAQRKPLKVCHITTVPISLKGLLLNQLLYLRDAGYDVLTISSAGPEVESLTEVGIPHIEVEMTRRFTPFADLRSLWQLYRVLRKERVDIVHTHNPKPGLLGQLAARLARVPVVVNTVHGFYFHDAMRPIAKRFYMEMERVAGYCSDRILSQNMDDMRTALDCGLARVGQISHLGNGIDLRRFDPSLISESERKQKQAELGIDENTLVVGFVGRLTHRKGFLQLLQAIAEVRTAVPNVRLLVVGKKDSDRADALGEAIAAEIGVDDICMFLGERPNDELPVLYSVMDVLALPSPFEGLPRAVMEASAMEVAAVVTDVKGNREAVIQGENGLLVPFNDVPALAQALTLVLQDSPNRRAMGIRGRARALSNFDERRVFKTILDTYAELIQPEDRVIETGERLASNQ